MGLLKGPRQMKGPAMKLHLFHGKSLLHEMPADAKGRAGLEQ